MVERVADDDDNDGDDATAQRRGKPNEQALKQKKDGINQKKDRYGESGEQKQRPETEKKNWNAARPVYVVAHTQCNFAPCAIRTKRTRRSHTIFMDYGRRRATATATKLQPNPNMC